MSSLLMNIGFFAVGFMLFMLLGFIVFCTDALREIPPRYTVDMVNVQDRELLMRENLEDTVLEDGESEWQCIVCLHMNNPDVHSCHLCGGAQEASTLTNTTVLLTDTAIMGNTILGSTFLSASGYNDIPILDVTMSTRQRALRYRRLNRMQLTQRQRGAQRRRLWQRVQLPNGGFIWVRTALPLLKKKDSLITRLRNNTHMRRNPRSNSLSETVAEQLHRKNAATMGFYSELDEHGQMSWKSTTDAVAVQIDEEIDPEDMVSGRAQDLFGSAEEDLDIEGLMSLPFKQKRRWFLRKVAAHSVPFSDSLFKVRVRRTNVLEDSVQALAGEMNETQCREHLNIHFKGEPALDAGGVLREWFGLVTKSLFSSDVGLFITTSGENSSYWINPLSQRVLGDEHLAYFKFAGRLFGKAILEGLVFDVNLSLPLLKHLLGVPITFSDLEFLDEELYKSCLWMRDNDAVDALCVTFSVQASVDDDSTVVDLKPGGRDIDVTDENKMEYLALVLKYRMLDSVGEQLGALLAGLYEIIPKSLLTVFDYQELDFFLCGLPQINVKDWQTHSRVRHFAGETDTTSRDHELQVVAWFWEVVADNFNDEERARLLQFATGSSRVPVEGFKALTSASGYVHQFTLQLIPRGVPPLGLCPRAHTCFNRIDLPVYTTKEELETYLTLVIQMEITGFGFE